jgi:hypothetical protein
MKDEYLMPVPEPLSAPCGSSMGARVRFSHFFAPEESMGAPHVQTLGEMHVQSRYLRGATGHARPSACLGRKRLHISHLSHRRYWALAGTTLSKGVASTRLSLHLPKSRILPTRSSRAADCQRGLLLEGPSSWGASGAIPTTPLQAHWCNSFFAIESVTCRRDMWPQEPPHWGLYRDVTMYSVNSLSPKCCIKNRDPLHSRVCLRGLGGQTGESFTAGLLERWRSSRKEAAIPPLT